MKKGVVNYLGLKGGELNILTGKGLGDGQYVKRFVCGPDGFPSISLDCMSIRQSTGFFKLLFEKV